MEISERRILARADDLTLNLPQRGETAPLPGMGERQLETRG